MILQIALLNGLINLQSHNMDQRFDHIVVGGGISGLTKAYALQKQGFHVLLLEKEKETGGVIQSKTTPYGVTELGPNSLALTPILLQLIEELGIEDQMIQANEAANKRYIYLKGRPVLINPKTLLFSNKIIGFPSKLRLISERFKPAKDISNESLAEVIRRRFSQEILCHLVEPVITGIYAGNPEKLEYKSSMKRMYEMEQAYGSFTKGFFKSRKSGNKRKIVSFKGGLQQLTNAISNKLAKIIYDEVATIELKEGQVQIITNSGNTFIANNITLAVPAFDCAKLLHKIDPYLSEKINQIEYPSLLGWQVTFKTESVKNRIPSFGILFPSISHKKIKGIINYSEIFSNNEEFRHYTVFSSFSPESMEESQSRVEREFREVYQIADPPIESNFTVYSSAIPQFNIGHGELMNLIDDWQKKHPQIEILGNWRTGVAIGDCINQKNVCC